jgi:hypothetical protein
MSGSSGADGGTRPVPGGATSGASGASALPCAVAARARGEPLAGTASVVRSWVLVEQPGPWGADALAESHLPPGVGRQLDSLGRRARARVLLVRRPDWTQHPPVTTRHCFVARTSPGSAWVRAVELAELLDTDWAALGSPEPPSLGTAVEEPLFLVCTHGRHDRCCADHGRPLVRALHAAGTAGVWECSHVGGDRFAANLVALPAGVYLGRLGPLEGPGVVAALVAGQLSLDHYRGRCWYPPDVQRAEAAAREATGWTALAPPALVDLERPAPDTLVTTWAFPDGRAVRATVRRWRAPAVGLTCHATTASSPWAYAVDEVVIGAGPLAG